MAEIFSAKILWRNFLPEISCDDRSVRSDLTAPPVFDKPPNARYRGSFASVKTSRHGQHSKLGT
jgi:hypothetical protein